MKGLNVWIRSTKLLHYHSIKGPCQTSHVQGWHQIIAITGLRLEFLHKLFVLFVLVLVDADSVLSKYICEMVDGRASLVRI